MPMSRAARFTIMPLSPARSSSLRSLRQRMRPAGSGFSACVGSRPWSATSTAVAHVKASNEHDLFLLQGWVQAGDRLFQMDVTRRRVSGTLAELLGSSALPSDVQTRTLGMRRSAERTVSVLSPGRSGPCRRTPTASTRGSRETLSRPSTRRCR